MFATYWNTAYRNLLKHKTFTFINIVGLAIAIASSIIILLYAMNELSYDAFHEDADKIHLVYKERNTAQGIRELDDTWVPLLPAMQDRYPSIENGVRLYSRDQWIGIENQKFRQSVTYADPSLFEVFTFPLAVGNSSTALEGTSSIILSQQMAEKFFGNENPLGKRITVNFEEDYLVTGVLEEIPHNSSIKFDLIAPFESAIAPDDEAANSNWGSSFLYTYILLDDNESSEKLQELFPDLVLNLISREGEEGANGTKNLQLKLWPLISSHDRNVNSDSTSYVLLAIAFGIILMACVNFINLETARSLERAREVGLRKTLGAHRNQLIGQFLGESVLISSIALVLGLILVKLLLPGFNALYDLNLSLDLISDANITAMAVAVGLFAGLLSGGYPALVLSRFKPVESLSGRLKTNPQTIGIRNGLTILQFGLAIALISAALVVQQQIRHMKNAELNFSPEQVVVIPVSLRDFENGEQAAVRIKPFKEEILKIPGAVSVSSSMSVPGDYSNSGNIFVTPEGWQGEQPLRMSISVADDNYFETYEMEFLEGRNFSNEFSTDQRSVILNEQAMLDMGWETAIGKTINRGLTIIGVVKDFNYQSLQNEIAAVIHIYRPGENNSHNFISVKLNTTNISEALVTLDSLWQSLEPSRGFSYYFADAHFESLYKDVSNMSSIVSYFCLLSILVANLGLLGLSSYSVARRTKEIGVRKVLGARVRDIVFLLSSQFTRPVIIANLVGWPVAYYGLKLWLQGYAYPVEINWMIFPLAGIFIFTLSLLTIATQSARAASANPVLSLRYE